MLSHKITHKKVVKFYASLLSAHSLQVAPNEPTMAIAQKSLIYDTVFAFALYYTISLEINSIVRLFGIRKLRCMTHCGLRVNLGVPIQAKYEDKWTTM